MAGQARAAAPIAGGRRPFPPTAHIVGALLAGMVFAPLQGHAQAIDVAPNTSLITTTGATPANGTIWNLTGSGIYLPSAVTLPANGTVTIEGNGNTLTLNNSGSYGQFTTTVSAPTSAVNLSNVTITGANNANGAAFFIRVGSLAINSTGSVSISGNHATIDGGAIEINSGNLSLGSAGSTTTVSGNSSDNSGGAIIVFGTTTFTGNTIMSNNAAVGTGGALFSYGAVNSVGSLTANSNTSGGAGSGGAIYAMTAGVTTDAISADGNTAGNNGGAISATGNVSLAAATGNVALTNKTAGTFSGVNGAGGAVFAGGADVSIGNTSGTNLLTGNRANYGGAVSLGSSAGGSLNLAGATTFSGNTAATGGGAIYGSGNLTLTAAGPTTISSNTTTAGSGGAIFARGNTTLTASGGDLTLANNRASANGGAIWSNGTATLAASGGSITFSGNSAAAGGGIYSSAGVTSTDGLTMNTNKATNGDGGAIFVQAGDVMTDTLTADGNAASGNGGAIVARSGNVSLATGTGAVALSSNTAANGGAVYANGNVSIGNASGTNAISGNAATANGGAINAVGSVTLAGITTLSNNTAGTNGGAVYATGDVTLQASGVTAVTGNKATAGAGGGIYAAGNVTLDATGGDIGVTGNTAHTQGGAIWVGANATLDAAGGNIVFQGNLMSDPQANAIWFDNTAGNASATLDAASGKRITFFDPVANNPDHGLLNVVATGPGTVAFDGSQHTDPADLWSTIYGNTQVQGGAFVVANNATYGTLAADVSQNMPTSFTVAPGATLSGGTMGTVRADNFTLGGTLNIAGAAPAGTAAGGYSTFNITSGNVQLASGSQVHFNTYLNDASVQRSDLLMLNLNGSATTGTAQVLVTNTGGAGQQTVGDGIELVQVANGSSANAFTLGKPVEAGAYQYLLYRGGVGANAGSENWYLRSDLEAPPTEPEEPGQPGEPGEPGVPEPPPAPGPVAWRPGVVGYVLNPLLNLDYGFKSLGTLHQRVGDVPGAIQPQGGTAVNGVWGRANVSSFDANTSSRFSTDSTTYYAQFGKDWTLDQPRDGGSTHAGVTATFGDTSASFYDAMRPIAGLSRKTGTVSTQAGSLGGYWTRYRADGTYFDSVGQVTYYHNRFGGEDGRASQDGVGVALSQEVGKPFRIASTPVAIEPQAQLMYQYLSLDGFNDAISSISGTHSNALRGRLGFRIFGADQAEAQAQTGNHAPLSGAKPYLNFDVLHDFLTPGETVVGDTSFNPRFTRTWFDTGAGVTAPVGKHGAFYAHVGYQHNIGGSHSQGYYGQLAYRYMW